MDHYYNLNIKIIFKIAMTLEYVEKKYYKKTTGIKKLVRTISGVTVVAIMCDPYLCPHGKCIYCPGGIKEGTPQSYVEGSPAVLRAINVAYEPYEQVKIRLLQYKKMGHDISKIELIVMGGTFPAMPEKYQKWFIARALKAMNDYPNFEKLFSYNKLNLNKIQRKNEYAKVRCIGLTIETRPDWSKKKHIDLFLKLGATRIELGVQSIYDDVLKIVRRGHTVSDTIEATRLLKDAGYKVCYHIMPGLPGSSIERDYRMFKEIFNNPSFKPDMIKIYPTIIVPGTKLYEMWRKGEYKPYSLEELIKLIAKVKTLVPRFIRIMRIQRDIPVNFIAAGLKIGNLRQKIKEYMAKRGMKCNCIRCREIGHKLLRNEINMDKFKVKMNKFKYYASEGIEIFLTFDEMHNDLLIALLRLRIPSSKSYRPEFDSKSAIIRELHVFGPVVPLGLRYQDRWQHKGFGRRLLMEAERIALEEYDIRKMFIISGIGVREYYRKYGYRKYKKAFYMYKKLK